jgi:hypothetical protein
MRRHLACSSMFFLLGTAAAAAQQVSTAESLRTAIQQSSQPTVFTPAVPGWFAPRRDLGVLTLVQPTTRGEMIRVVVPIGDLVSRASRSVSRVSGSRAERRARERVARELREF